MLNKIYRKIFEYLEMIDDKKFHHGWREVNNSDGYLQELEDFLIIQKKIMRFTNVISLDCFYLFNALITLIIFIISWKYDIKLVPIEIIIAYRYVLYYCFYFMVLMLVIKLIKGIYAYIKDKKWIKIMEVYWTIIRFLSFVINCYIVMWICNINFFELLQYNVIFIITNINLLIFSLHMWVGGGIITGKDFTNFVSYPWIIIIIVYILVWMDVQEGFKVAYIIREYCIWELREKEE